MGFEEGFGRRERQHDTQQKLVSGVNVFQLVAACPSYVFAAPFHTSFHTRSARKEIPAEGAIAIPSSKRLGLAFPFCMVRADFRYRFLNPAVCILFVLTLQGGSGKRIVVPGVNEMHSKGLRSSI